MSKKLLSCGGLYIDDETITETDGILSASGGGSDLPTVTSDDNGDVLTVVEGTWAKATPSGGGALIVETEVTEGVAGGVDVTLKSTWQEIHDAIIGKTLVFILVSSELIPFLLYNLVESVGTDQGAYIVQAGETYVAESSSGYPTVSFTP